MHRAMFVSWMVLLVAPAGATVLRTDEQRLTWFLPTAQAQWPGSPCAGHETVTLHDDAEINSLGSYWGYAFGECRAGLVSGLDDYTFCVVLTHELGHLAGEVHSTDPKSVMNPTVPTSYAPCVSAMPAPTPHGLVIQTIDWSFGARVHAIRWVGRLKAIVSVRWPSNSGVSRWVCQTDRVTAECGP